MAPEKRDLLSAGDLGRDELENLLELAQRTKDKRSSQLLVGKTLALLFFDRSLRTRVSFEVAAQQLGAHCINVFADRELYGLEPEEEVVMDGPAEEHVKDAARTLSRYVDLLGVRQLSRTGSWEVDRRETLLHGYARHATVPVVNLESTMEHPCQAIADVMTMRENLTRLQGRRFTLAWSMNPEPKNMGPCHSLLRLVALSGMTITLAHPLGFELDHEIVEHARRDAEMHGGSLRVVNDLEEGVRSAEVVYTRSWGSTRYWDDPERERMVKRSLQSWIFDERIMGLTDDALFMHPLPVRRGVGATDAVLDGRRSVIYDQAGNRTPAQKALLTFLLG
ncbi:MAG: N-acetylornithine carbamoyltransferase [Planctomycetes bacterium]|nr:N-acetylornithine carbamoyltransferase [Planctomycetota bacterium]